MRVSESGRFQLNFGMLMPISGMSIPGLESNLSCCPFDSGPATIPKSKKAVLTNVEEFTGLRVLHSSSEFSGFRSNSDADLRLTKEGRRRKVLWIDIGKSGLDVQRSTCL